jgi:2-dehydro-3-deoxygalactonokinase
MNIEWIAVDWGTTNMRLWAMAADGSVLAERFSERGMGTLTPEAYEETLLATTEGLLPEGRTLPVVICGMAGARQGWREAPYAEVPCPPVGTGAVEVPTRDARLAVRILPGLSQRDPADVMRGEETQIAGFLESRPGFAGTICLPGTHTKWANVAQGRVLAFRTFMTGEIFGLLSTASVLRHSMSEGWDADAFAAGLSSARAAPEAVPASFFALRAGALLDGLTPAAARARLSGLLIGAELAGIRSTLTGGTVAIIGPEALSELYAQSLASEGAEAELTEVAGVTLAGLRAAHTALSGEFT